MVLLFWSLAGKHDHYAYVIMLSTSPFPNNIDTDIIAIQDDKLWFEDTPLLEHKKKYTLIIKL